MSDVPTQIINVEMGGGPQGPSNPGPPGPAGTGFAPVAAVATGNVALAGIQNLDGVTGVAGQRVFLPYQTNPSQNGIWVQAAGAWTRPSDFASGTTPAAAVVVVTQGGNIYGRSQWILATTGVTIDTTNQVWQLATVPRVQCGVHCSTAQVIPNAVDTLIQHNTIDHDTAGAFNTGTHLFTAPFTGYYSIALGARGQGNLNAAFLFLLGIYKNKTTGSPTWAQPGANAQGYSVVNVRRALLNAGDTIGAELYQNSGVGASLDNVTGGSGNHMEIALEALT